MRISLFNNHSKQYLEEVYLFDAAKKAFTIQVAVNQYDELFNRLDPTPLHQRDLAPDLMAFLKECSEEIPFRYQINLLINVSQENRDSLVERKVLEGFRHYFLYEINVISDQLRHTRRRALKYVLVSFLSITSAALLRGLLEENLIMNYLREGLTIGGWVFLWEAISVSFIQSDPINRLKTHLRRLQQADIRFHTTL